MSPDPSADLTVTLTPAGREPVRIGPGRPLTVIAGPCVAEGLELCLDVGRAMRDACHAAGLGYVFKASFDKANRSSITSPRGPGLEQGLAWIAEAGRTLGVPTTTDIHEPGQAGLVADQVDLLQIPAFLCRQTDLLLAAGRTGRAINVKKGQFMSPAEMNSVLAKLREAAAPIAEATGSPPPGVMLTERGTFFGYQRLVNDFVGLGDLMDLGAPVCFDVTHSTQQPGASGDGAQRVSGGRPDRAPLLARAAVAAGVHALFLETHPSPGSALSDGATMLRLEEATALVPALARLAAAR